MAGMRVVVTGGAGFLGSHLCEALLARGDTVVCLDNLSTGNLRNIEHLFGRDGFEFVKHDVTNYVYVRGDVDAVMHFASPASPKDYLEMPIQTLKVGSLGTHKTLGLAKDKGARFFLASTSEVYGDPEVHPQPESYWGHVNPIGPRGVYDEAKRFAEAMTMAYHRYHGVDVRIVRIFNSILADEQVLYDDGRELRRERIGDLAERLGRPSVDLDGYTVPSFDAGGRIAAREAIALVGHPPTGPCFEVRTRYGRSIRVTGDHSVFVESTDGPVAKPVSQLAVGDRIAIAGRITVPERERAEVTVVDAWIAAGRDPWNLLVRSPGLGELAWRHRFELAPAMAAAGLGGRAVKPRNAIWSKLQRWRSTHQTPLGALQRLGDAVPADATVRLRTAGLAAELPNRVSITDELLWLLGLYVAEGCRHERPQKSAFIAIAGAAPELERAAKILERDLGVRVVHAPSSPARAASIFVHSQLLLLLLDHLGFTGGEKRIPGWILGLPLSRLKWFLEGYRAGDGVHSGAKFAEGVRHEFSTTSTALKDDLVIALGRFGIVPSVGRYETTFKQRTGDRRYPFWRLTVPYVSPWSPLDWDRGVDQHLQARRFGDLVWAPITAIEEIDPTELVYDFSVPGTENFLAGTGVMAHNTYGTRMRPRDGRVVSNFLVQALRGKPLTIYGDGSQSRSFCYVDDEVRGFLALLDSDLAGQPCNIGNPGEFTVNELAELVLEVTNSESEIVYEDLPVDDPTQRQPDLTLAHARLGWEPTIELREGLERTAEYLRSLEGHFA